MVIGEGRDAPALVEELGVGAARAVPDAEFGDSAIESAEREGGRGKVERKIRLRLGYFGAGGVDDWVVSGSIAPVPEPGTLSLLLVAAAFLAARHRAR